MERLTIQVGGFEANCSILSENGKAWIVDPGQEADRIIDLLAKKGLEPAGVLLTHGHFDHIGAIPGLLEKFPELPIYIHEKDAPMFGHPLNQLPPEYPSFAKPRNLTTLDKLEDLKGLEIVETPGHTPGGVCYYFPKDKLLLSGDTLFAGSVGRTDFPGGDMATLMDSLQKLAADDGTAFLLELRAEVLDDGIGLHLVRPEAHADHERRGGHRPADLAHPPDTAAKPRRETLRELLVQPELVRKRREHRLRAIASARKERLRLLNSVHADGIITFYTS